MCPMTQSKKTKNSTSIYSKTSKKKIHKPNYANKKTAFLYAQKRLKKYISKTNKDSILRLKASKKSPLLVFYAF